MADVELLHRLSASAFVAVVIRQLDARLDVLEGVDPDVLALDNRLAVRIARVIDETGVIFPVIAVNAPVIVETEEERVMPRHVFFVVTAIGLVVRNYLARVLDDLLARAEPLRGKNSSTLNC